MEGIDVNLGVDARDRLIVALDLPSRGAALAVVDLLGDDVLWYKVGLELYLAEGAGIVRELTARGKRVFLDLKLHDIPNTVAGAVRSVAQGGASLLTLHAAGGPVMLRAAVDAAHEVAAAPKLLAVTVLTSMDATELAAVGVEHALPDQVQALGRMALSCGVDGLVCSTLEVQSLRELGGPGPLLVVPGIRSATGATGDQRRTASAVEALDRGASMVVVGRPITQAIDPANAARAVLLQMDHGRTESV